MKTLIICPLQFEVQHLLAALGACGAGWESVPFGSDCAQRFLNRPWWLVRGGHGKVDFALRTQQWLQRLPESMDQVIGVGSGGALAEDLEPGDVVLAQKIIEHDFRARFDPQAKVPEFTTDENLWRSLNSLSKTFAGRFQLRVGAIASGDEDIVGDKRAQELFQQTGACTVGWEGAGLARACRAQNLRFLEIRGITDNARKNVAADFKKNLQRAMANVAELLWTGLGPQKAV